MAATSPSPSSKRPRREGPAKATRRSRLRLRLHGLIERVPRTNTYVLTPDGARVAVSYTKVHGRLLRLSSPPADHPPAPVELRRALATIDRVINDYALTRAPGRSRVKLAEMFNSPATEKS